MHEVAVANTSRGTALAGRSHGLVGATRRESARCELESGGGRYDREVGDRRSCEGQQVLSRPRGDEQQHDTGRLAPSASAASGSSGSSACTRPFKAEGESRSAGTGTSMVVVVGSDQVHADGP